jgi:hypothetical protein
MSLPAPEPGMVIRYDYVWQRETRVTGKERPACLVATLDDDTDPQLVVIVPITHSPPTGVTVGMEIPGDIAKTLGLDAARSWIVISEANVDYWPNAGLGAIPNRRGSFVYGYLPPALFEKVRAGFKNLLSRRLAKITRR